MKTLFQAMVVGGALAVLSTIAVATSLVTLDIQADIDGRDQLIIKNDTVQWHHYDWAAVGRHEGANPATIINGISDPPGFEWIPEWPLQPPDEIRFEAYSSVLSGVIDPLPRTRTRWEVEVVFGRGTVSIVEQPSAANDYSLIVEFNDNAHGGWASYGVNLTVVASHGEEYKSLEYFPLQTGNQWTYETDGVPEGTQTVLADTYEVNGVATRKLLWDPIPDAEYWTNDAEGLRIHRVDFYDSDRGVTNYLVFSPPVTQLPAEFAIGDVVTGTGTATYVYPGIGSFPSDYEWNNQIEAVETLTIPFGTYSAIRSASSLRIYDQYDDFTSHGVDWYTRYVGWVKWMSINDGSTTVLTSVWVDTDGDWVNVTDDNCPSDTNASQADADADGAGDVCDNCIYHPNGPAIPDAGGNIQLDTDGDQYGNRCDGDLNNDEDTNIFDLGLFKQGFGGTDPTMDFTGDGNVNIFDLGVFKQLFGSPPGPSCCAAP